jgi:hypothetical protein
LYLLTCGFGVGEDAAGEREQGQSRVGEIDVAAGAAEEFRAEFVFEVADLLGEGWLGDVDAFGGTGEVVGVGDSEEVDELLELHDPTIGASYRDQLIHVLDLSSAWP